MIRQPLRFLAALVIISALLFLLDQTRFFSATASFTESHLLSPVVSGSRGALIKGAGFFSSLFSFRTVVNELTNIERERDFYRGEYLRLQAVDDENDFLRQALDVQSGRQKLILATVTAHDIFQPNQKISIDKGERDGVRAGQAVVVNGRTLTGIVQSVDTTTSNVLLITSEEARIPVLLAASQTNAVITGSATGVLELDLVPREVPLNEEELLVTSGIAGNIPPNLLVGTIRRIIDDETASFKRAVVDPLVNIGSLRQVFVITGL